MSAAPDQPSLQKKIQSFIRRQGRLTGGQQLALDTLWDTYCLDPKADYDFSQVYGRNAPLILEIGFGNGEGLAEIAKNNPDNDYLGIEVHRPGVGHLMMLLNQQQINNVRIYCHDAIEILEQKLPDHSLAGVHLFFPDPWPKQKHQKRRIVNPDFLNLLSKKLQPSGYFHAATDWQHYAGKMLAFLNANPLFQNTSTTGDYCPRPESRPLTKFEQRGIRLGHGVWDIVFKII